MDNYLKVTARVKAFFAVLLVTVFANVTLAQQAGPRDETKSLNYGFVSPNTDENLQLDDAIKKMRSPEEAKLLARVQSFRCVIQSRINSFRALGSWSDGAEYSVMLRVKSDERTIRYLLSRLGKEARQKSVLYFHPMALGSSRIYALRVGRRHQNLKTIASVMEDAGLTFQTLVPGRRNTIVFIVDLKRELHAHVLEAASKLKAGWSSEVGLAEFIGDDSSAEKARTVYDQEIANYETQHAQLPPTCQARSSGHLRLNPR